MDLYKVYAQLERAGQNTRPESDPLHVDPLNVDHPQEWPFWLRNDNAKLAINTTRDFRGYPISPRIINYLLQGVQNQLLSGTYQSDYASEEDVEDKEEKSMDFTGTTSNWRNSTSSPGRGGSVTLADQFTWGAVVCAGVFIIVFVCVMTAWWVHKKQQEYVRSRAAHLEARRQAALAPFCIDNSVRTLSRGQLNNSGNQQLQHPPSYFEVIGFFDPPPSYNDILTIAKESRNLTTLEIQGYDNMAITIDEPPPPFTEEEPKSEVIAQSDESSANVENNFCTVIIVPSSEEQSSNA